MLLYFHIDHIMSGREDSPYFKTRNREYLLDTKFMEYDSIKFMHNWKIEK